MQACSRLHLCQIAESGGGKDQLADVLLHVRVDSNFDVQLLEALDGGQNIGKDATHREGQG